MKKIIMFLILFPCMIIADQGTPEDVQNAEVTEQKKKLSKLEKTEQRADYLDEKIEYYKTVVENVRLEEEELKKLKKQSLLDIKKNKN